MRWKMERKQRNRGEIYNFVAGEFQRRSSILKFGGAWGRIANFCKLTNNCGVLWKASKAAYSGATSAAASNDGADGAAGMGAAGSPCAAISQQAQVAGAGFVFVVFEEQHPPPGAPASGRAGAVFSEQQIPHCAYASAGALKISATKARTARSLRTRPVS